MGIAANQVRLLTLQSRMNDLEYQCMKYSSEEVALAFKSGEVSNEYHRRLDRADAVVCDTFAYFDLQGNKIENPTNTTNLIYTIDYSQRDKLRAQAEQYYETETDRISKQEKTLSMLSKSANTEYQTACTEYESIKSLIKDNTSRSFSIFG